MILTLFDQNKAFNLVLPERVTGRYVLSNVDQNGNSIDMMAVEAEEGVWYLKSNKYAFLLTSKNEKATKVAVEPFKTYTIYRENEPPALLYVEPPTTDRNEYSKHYVTTNIIKIGRAKENHICYSNKIVSSAHCAIEYHQDIAVIRDLNSSNGTYVNGERIQEKTLAIGDVINIMGLKIIYNGRLLSLNNPHLLVYIDKNAFKPFSLEKPIVGEEEELDDFNQDQKEIDNLFYRSPRFKRDITPAEIKIDPPPQPSSIEETPLMFMLGPSITMGMASLFTGLLTLQNVMRTNGDIMMAMPTLVMSLSMLLGTILWPILTKRYENKRRIAAEKVRQEKYKQYLEEMAARIEEECHHQREILHENHVSLVDCVSRIILRKRNLWERSIGQNDFLKMRLGLGNLPLQADLKFPEKKFSVTDDNLMDELYQLADTPQVLEEVPVTLSFAEERVSGIIGNRGYVSKFVEGLIFQLTALHSYDELKLVFLYDKSEHEWWKFVRWLPHVWDDSHSIRFIATDASEIKVLSSHLEKEIARRNELSDEDLKEITKHYVIFSMDKALASRAEMVSMVLKEKRNIGFSLITLYDELNQLPKECTQVVELDRESSKLYDKDDISGRYTAFRQEPNLQDDADELAMTLANIHLDSLNHAYTLPEMLTFMEMFGVSKIEHLNALTRWKENNPVKTIETPIGVDTSGELFKIDLHEKYHGPHGLIAGMTGSGKSEFIMTFILSLAVNYHPDEVAFILIDYKGGGMANAFLNLPHLAGTITNLDGAAVNRSLISIQSELKRRQAIFSETSRRVNESNIDIYKYQKLYREGLVSEPLQHLFIISDEFAELKTQQPEFMAQLVSAARIGRSLGVHLILATQKPSGVVDDQIWSNSKFRISLKVQEKADSMEVIKRPDAAELSTTGRFYLQVGFNEVFELGQSAWAGAPYYPAEKVEKRKDNSVDVIDTLGRVLRSGKIDKQKNQTKNPPKQIDEITKYLATLASQEHIKVRQLWLEQIPALIYLDELRVKYASRDSRYELNPVIGEYDDPSTQSQNILRLPLTEEGNTVIYGVTGSGKTTFLASMIYSLMEEHTPEELNLYLLDFSLETLSWFREAPHVGDVVLSHESEKVSNLFKLLSSEIEKRKKLLSNHGGDFVGYNQKASPGQGLASIVVMIHNYSAFSEMYEMHEETISYLTREGLKYGIYFIVTAANTSAIRYRLLQNFKKIYVLQLNDNSDYSGVLGNVGGVYPSRFKGRGIFKTDKVYEFQVAHIRRNTGDIYSFITGFCKDLREKWTGSQAKRIPILPEKVDLEYLRSELTHIELDRLPVGVEKNSMRTSFFDVEGSFINLVMAASNEQATGFMKGTAEVTTALGDAEVIVLDPNCHFAGDRSSYKYVSTKDELEKEVVYLFETLVYRNNTTKDTIAAGGEKPVFNKIVCLLDSFTDINELLSADGKDKLAVFLDKGSGLNVHILLSDSADKISSVSYEPWFKKQVSLSDGIWIGNGIAEQYVLKANKITSEMYKEIPADFGYVLKKGKPTLVKLLTSSAFQEEGVLIYG